MGWRSLCLSAAVQIVELTMWLRTVALVPGMNLSHMQHGFQKGAHYILENTMKPAVEWMRFADGSVSQ